MADLFEFSCPVKIVSGHKALSNLPYEMEQLGASRALLITDQGVVGAGLLKTVKSAMEGSGCELASIYDSTPVDSSNKVVNEVAKIFKSNNCDCIIALGGGSCIDTAKGVNMVVSEGTDDLMQFQGTDRLTKTPQPFIVIPTTAGTGSEVTAAAVIKDVDRNVKMPFVSDKMYPDVAINDPEMTMTMPAKITAATGMDALTHAVESYYCIQKNPISDAFAISAIKLIFENLVKAVENPKDKDARINMLNASTLAGIAFSNSMVGIVHALAHATGGVAYVPHGVANAIYLPFGMENNFNKVAGTIGELAYFMGVRNLPDDDMGKARAAVKAVRDLNQKLHELTGLPIKLSQAGVAESQIEEIAKQAINDGACTYNPEEVEYKDALEVVKKAF